jgi:hypothetical protein
MNELKQRKLLSQGLIHEQRELADGQGELESRMMSELLPHDWWTEKVDEASEWQTFLKYMKRV